jgi:hypothetical protein
MIDRRTGALILSNARSVGIIGGWRSENGVRRK